MPYLKLKDLPDSVRHHLPLHGQEIYLAAFNHAWDEYEDPKKRNTDESQETVAHKVAWSAVKAKYHKVDEVWQEK